MSLTANVAALYLLSTRPRPVDAPVVLAEPAARIVAAHAGGDVLA